MMLQSTVLGRLINDPELQVLDIVRLRHAPRYRIIVYRAEQRDHQCSTRILVVDLEATAYAVPGALLPQIQGMPIRSQLLQVDGRVQLVGTLDPELCGTRLRVVLSDAQANLRRRAAPIENGVAVADLGPGCPELSIGHLSVEDPTGTVIWQTIGHPQLNLAPSLTALTALRWYTADPARAIARYCRTPGAIVL